MAREVSLFLKYPGSHIALQRLQHSFLECVVEHKSGSLEELQRFPPSYLKSDYQLKGTAALVDDELVITFTPKHSGLYTVRIFADTRELCKPVAFIVSQNNEVESTPINKPVKPTSSLFRDLSPSPALLSPVQPFALQQQQLRMSQAFGTQAQRMQSSGHGPTQWGGGGERGIDGSLGLPPQQQQQQQQELQPQQQPQQLQQQQQDQVHPALSDDDHFHHGFMSDPALPTGRQSAQMFQESPGKVDLMGLQQQQRFSHVTSAGGGSRPVSMLPAAQDEKGFAGDLISMAAEKSSFNELYVKRLAGETGVKVQRDFLMMDHTKVVTPETFAALNKDINQMVGTRGLKTRRR